ncbi:unnamed protein product, partial [Brenthis ino]
MYLKTFLLRNVIKQCKVKYFAPVITHSYDRNEHTRHQWNCKKNATIGLLGSVLIGSAVKDKQKVNNETKESVLEAGEKQPGLPTYTADEVSKHDNKDSFWVTYRHGVYDVTSFLPSHPGGEQILNAAGLSVEPFWNVYGMHKTEEVYKLLESYRIGNLHDDDVLDHSDDELWAKEPYRDKRLIIKTAKPFNAETPPELLVENFYTPNELFFVRQHMPVPDIDPNTHKLKVTIVGDTDNVKEFSLEDLSMFPTETLDAALMCAGNRRTEMNKPVAEIGRADIIIIVIVSEQVRPVKGLGWAAGAISNARWRGAALRDVLLHCGLDPRRADLDDLHVILTGADIDATGENFSTSIPLRTALDANARVLLATEMNGAPLPRDHGAPLRAIVPGAPAVRSVKWLQSITVSRSESSSHWHQRDYRSFNASTTWESADFPAAPPVYSLPVTAAACAPAHGDAVCAPGGRLEVRGESRGGGECSCTGQKRHTNAGYAYSGGGARVLRVDVSADRGRSWRAAALAPAPAAGAPHYAWALWRVALPVPPDATEVEIWVKATDSNFNTQPENFDDIWNIRGILANAYHKIKVNIKQ